MKVITIILLLVSSAYAKSENVRNIKPDESFVVKNYANITRLGEILNLFSINKIGSSWKEISLQLSRKCARDMSEYLSGLEERKFWALKSKFSSDYALE